MGQTYSFKNRELLIISKNADTLLYSSRSWKFQSKRASRPGTGARRTWQPMIFTCFAASSPLKFSWHSSFNLARRTCSFYWYYLFIGISFEYSWSKNINTEGKHMPFYSYWCYVHKNIRKLQKCPETATGGVL